MMRRRSLGQSPATAPYYSNTLLNNTIMAKETQQVTTATAAFPALNNLPDLDKCEVAPTELLGEYWSPAEAGETKRVFFVGFDVQNVIEQATGENRELNIVKFLEKQGGEYRTIRNGSARLVGAFEQFARDLNPGQPFQITYLGKKKTNTGKFADSWSVKPIIIK